jgi:hypothetical protein
MENNLTLLQHLQEELHERNITIVDHTRKENCILAKDKDNRALFFYTLSTNCDGWCETDLLSHVSKGYDKTFSYLLKKNGMRLMCRETDNNYFDMLVSQETYQSWKRTAKHVNTTAREAEKEGQYVEIDRRLSLVVVHRGEEDEFCFRDSEADKLIKEAEQSRLHHFCAPENIILWQAQGW